MIVASESPSVSTRLKFLLILLHALFSSYHFSLQKERGCEENMLFHCSISIPLHRFRFSRFSRRWGEGGAAVVALVALVGPTAVFLAPQFFKKTNLFLSGSVNDSPGIKSPAVFSPHSIHALNSVNFTTKPCTSQCDKIWHDFNVLRARWTPRR